MAIKILNIMALDTLKMLVIEMANDYTTAQYVYCVFLYHCINTAESFSIHANDNNNNNIDDYSENNSSGNVYHDDDDDNCNSKIDNGINESNNEPYSC